MCLCNLNFVNFAYNLKLVCNIGKKLPIDSRTFADSITSSNTWFFHPWNSVRDIENSFLWTLRSPSRYYWEASGPRKEKYPVFASGVIIKDEADEAPSHNSYPSPFFPWLFVYFLHCSVVWNSPSCLRLPLSVPYGLIWNVLSFFNLTTPLVL